MNDDLTVVTCEQEHFKTSASELMGKTSSRGSMTLPILIKVA